MPPSGRPEAGTPSTSAGELLAQGGTLVTATHRLARHLRRTHDEAMAARGAEAWPSADVLPLDAWLRRIWDSLAVRDHPLARQRLLTDVECRLVWNQVVAQGSDDSRTALIAPLAASSWRLCQLWGIAAGELLPSADTDDARAFAGWVARYRDRLASHDWTDSTALLAALPAALGDPTVAAATTTGPAIGFAGFSPMPPAVRALAAALATALERRHATVPVINAIPRHRTTRIVAARDAADELAQAFRWAAGLLDRNPGASVAIVVGNLESEAATARRIGLDMLAPGWQLHEPAARPVALAAGRQLTDFPVVNTALALLRLIAGGGTFAEASHLLRSPYLKGAAAGRTGRALAELKLREKLSEAFSLDVIAEVLRSRAPDLAASFSATATAGDTLRSQRLLPGQWVIRFHEWLDLAGWPGDRGLDSTEHQAIKAWQELLAAFAATDEVAGRLPAHAAIDQLSAQARDRAFEPEAADGAVQVLNLREACGQSFDGLWLTGVTAEQWPAAARAHALVPLALQRAAGIPEAAAYTQEKAVRQRLAELVAATDELVLSWPNEREGAIQLPSPLLHDERVTGEVSAGSGPGTASGHPLREAILAQSMAPEAAIEEVADPAPALVHDDNEAFTQVRGGSGVLAMQAVCPARAFIEFRLRGVELRTPARLLDASHRGRLVHRLLERLYGLPACHAGLGLLGAAELREQYDHIIEGVLDEFLPRRDPFAAGLRPLETTRLWQQVEALHARDAGRPGFTVETEVERQVQVGALRMKLRLDRIDHLAGGGELVIDYKTGRFEAAGWKKARLQNSQLPLYAVTEGASGVAVAKFVPMDVRLVGVGDPGLGITALGVPSKFFKPDDLDWPAVMARWRRQLESLAAEFAGGDFRVNPADRSHAVGQYASATRIFEFATDDDADSESPEMVD